MFPALIFMAKSFAAFATSMGFYPILPVHVSIILHNILVALPTFCADIFVDICMGGHMCSKSIFIGKLFATVWFVTGMSYSHMCYLDVNIKSVPFHERFVAMCAAELSRIVMELHMSNEVVFFTKCFAANCTSEC